MMLVRPRCSWLPLALSLSVLSLSTLAGCSLARSPIFEEDDGGGFDGGGFDAPIDAARPDVPGLDAPLFDVPLDAPIALLDAPDAPLDAPLDTPPDVPTDARCSSGPDRDFDGVVDVCDPCPDDAMDDSDGDGVCDSMDACPGQNDRSDADGDTVPDGCDDWPCGVRPTVTLPVTESEARITGLSLNGGGTTIVVDPGATVMAAVDYAIADCGCSGCIDQIEVGLVPGNRAFCAYDGNPPMCPAESTGSRTRTITAPATPGRYDVRFTRAQDLGCNAGGRTDWWLGAPGDATTIGVICVR